MRVLVAPDSFKGTFTATEVASALAEGVRSVGAESVECPLADGGEGTATVLAGALGARIVDVRVTGPLGEPVTGWFGLADDGTALVEAATASGLSLVDPTPETAWAATSRGTGELIAAAVAAGASRVLLGVGGSACTDGGLGAVEALAGVQVGLRVLCDVRVPYERAAEVFGPQKGADPATVERLTSRLHERAAGWPRDPRGAEFTGAAGGLAGGLWAAAGAELVSGIEAVLDVVGFDDLLATADLVVTGEGRLDAQTAHGKVVAGVCARAGAAGVPVLAVVGRCDLAEEEWRALGLSAVLVGSDRAGLRAAAATLPSS
ncbi:glycerate kinase [Spongisporangium articulatum]|uniref:Glycerate kinase n=1 Tax=Spongisporangium articulatum TaxID=3362603 RepID=A0ABW8AL46_9ACTN